MSSDLSGHRAEQVPQDDDGALVGVVANGGGDEQDAVMIHSWLFGVRPISDSL
jgi:hypothetical protein